MWFAKITSTTPKRMKQLERDTGGAKYVKWRNTVLERDNFQCQWIGCFEKDGLQIHHILRWADAKNLRHNPFNGITLCRKHHEHICGREKLYASMFAKKAQANHAEQEKKKNENPL